MSTVQALQRSLHEEEISWYILTCEIVSNRCIDATCTRNEYLSFIFRVEIDEVFTCHETRLHTKCTSQTCLFVTRKNALYWAMFNVITVKDS